MNNMIHVDKNENGLSSGIRSWGCTPILNKQMWVRISGQKFTAFRNPLQVQLWLCPKTHTHIYLNIYTYIYVYIYVYIYAYIFHQCISSHQHFPCSFNRLSRCSSKISKLLITGLCEGHPPVTSQRTSNAENVSISKRHHVGWNYPYPSMLWLPQRINPHEYGSMHHALVF